MMGSLTVTALIFSGPVQVTVSGEPGATVLAPAGAGVPNVPDTGTEKVEEAVAWAWAGVAASSRPPDAPPASHRTAADKNRRVLMFGSVLKQIGSMIEKVLIVMVSLRAAQKAVGRMSSGGTKVTPCGVEMGVGSGRRKGAPPLSISHRISMALSSWTVLWQCSMNIPPQSRNCMVIVR